MANNVLNTRISLCSDTTANLEASTKVYLKGEAVVEFCENGSVKLKVGDGINTWNDLPYIAGGGSSTGGGVYTVVQADTTDIDTAVATLGLTDLKGGEMVIITTDASLRTANCMGFVYVVDGEKKEWHAFAGNVTSDNVIISQNFTGAGNYTQVGNITKTSSGTTTLAWEGKTLNDVLTAIFSKELQPSKTEPSVSITFAQAGSYEVGTTVTPSYSATLNAGSYTYGPATGVVASAWNVTDTASNTSTSASDSFPSLVVGDDTNYKITAEATHNEGAIAVTNLGNASNPEVKIAAGTKTKTSGYITGFRAFFYGAVATDAAIDSAMIRSLTNGGNYNGAKTLTVIAADVPNANRIIVAYPKATTRGGLTKVVMPSALYADVTSQYVQQTDVMVEGVAGYTSVAYTVYEYKPAKLDSSEVHEITLA